MSSSRFYTQEVIGSDYRLVAHKQVLSYVAATSNVAKFLLPSIWKCHAKIIFFLNHHCHIHTTRACGLGVGQSRYSCHSKVADQGVNLPTATGIQHKLLKHKQ